MFAAWLLAGCLLAQSAPAEKAVESPLRPQVSKLVRQLDASEKDVRDEAEEQLLKLGPAAIDLLSPMLKAAKSAEVKERLGRVIERLQRQQDDVAALATRVTLPKATMPLTDIWQALEKQTGNKIIDLRSKFGQEQTNPKIEVDFQNAPFWQALDPVLDRAGLSLYHYPGQPGLAVVAAAKDHAPRSGHAIYAGPFRIEATQLIARRDLRAADQSQLQVTLETAWEPRLAPISIGLALGDLNCTYDNELRAKFDKDNDARLQAEVQAGTTAVELQLPLPLPPRSVKKITSLKGKLEALVPGRVEAFEFDKLKDTKRQEQKRAGCTVYVDEVRKNQDVWEVHMRVNFDRAEGALESYRGWVFNNEAYMVGPDGKRVPNSGSETTRQAEDEVGVAYFFELPDGPTGYKFVYKTPVSIHKMPVEFELKGLELP